MFAALACSNEQNTPAKAGTSDSAGNGNLASTSTDNSITFTVISTSLTITSIEDSGDGICDATCTLREALVAANATAGVKNISFHRSQKLQSDPEHQIALQCACHR